ncbi:M1 family metallopeptidase [Microbulbifer thermotolerans]|uniref:M1 family metallopeptidase n=1 Tax=Microbulbifer thermotolerans TaxID=252514 RepID=UPI0022495805|nr:M1 family metallopeptidase [Microbulbifer thermotolerans]MCX2794960.1 M1 family metallopeptidase [Microbulbifer thermotolerans]
MNVNSLRRWGAAIFAMAGVNLAMASDPLNVTGDKFRQLDELLPTPNAYRTASGAPGHAYWQQQADYDIQVSLDDDKQLITASETVTYTNNSPDTLRYLWLQLDQNRFKPDSMGNLATPVDLESIAPDTIPFGVFRRQVVADEFPGGYQISRVADSKGRELAHTIVDTGMRIDLPKPLKSGEQVRFQIDWSYKVIEQKALGGRSGYEYFERDDNYLYEIAQWFPRMAAYNDVSGWQNKPFLGRGEFALEFGNYRVAINVPADHVVAATGVLQNPEEVLTREQRARLKKARTAQKPVMIITKEEALKNEKSRSKKRKTWIFEAENVRDFSWASSRKFLWDAQGYKKGGTDTLAMSFYPEEGMPLWDKYSTETIIHTMDVYNRYSFDYPYPVSISVNGPVGGMEYPMITFNGPRPEIDDEDRSKRTYSRTTKYGLISVIIHEVGHNYFPMIVNSDERQWTWMDEGLNTFLQFLAEQEWEEKYPSRRGDARKIVDYMKSDNQVPIMTNSESILQFGNNAYGKPATALNILRESIMGRELFDFAFREYAQRWKFKRPMPADFFRTMEDASGMDLDWFWRGWFYTTDHVDISLDQVRHYTVGTKNPDIEGPWKREQHNSEPETITAIENRARKLPRIVDAKPELADFYNKHDEFDVSNADRNSYRDMLAGLEDWERDMLSVESNVYVLDFSNIGGLVMPLFLRLEYEDGTVEDLRIPAEIWAKNSRKTSKMLVRDKNKILKSVILDPHWETADVNVENNYYPRRIIKSRLELFKEEKRRNLMKDWDTELKEKG